MSISKKRLCFRFLIHILPIWTGFYHRSLKFESKRLNCPQGKSINTNRLKEIWLWWEGSEKWCIYFFSVCFDKKCNCLCNCLLALGLSSIYSLIQKTITYCINNLGMYLCFPVASTVLLFLKSNQSFVFACSVVLEFVKMT